MPERPATPDEVKQIEAYADNYFRRESGVSELWTPPAIEQLLDVGEEIITGHRAPQDEYARARARLTLTTTNNINLGIKTISQFGLTRKETPPDDLKERSVRLLGLCQAYVALQDAFTSYWKGYATAVIEESNILRFDTVPNELDIRLRSHSADDELGGDKPVFPTIGIGELGPILATLPTRSSVHQEGGVRYKLRRNHILNIATMYTDALRRSYRDVPNINLGGLTFDDLLQGWAILLAVSRLHQVITLLMSDDPTDFTTSINWPAIHRERKEWLRWFSALPNGELVMDALTMNPSERSGDISVTPVIPITKDWFGLIPAVTLAANAPRNLLILTARRFQAAYSSYSIEREGKIIADLIAACGQNVIGSGINLPKVQGIQLPDIDVLLRGDTPNTLVITEVKWQLSAADTKEVIARNDYLKKGQRQLSAIREFLFSNPGYLRSRGLINFDVSKTNTTFLLLCKGHLGSADVLSPHSTMADYDVFVKYVRDGSVAEALERVAQYDYLPVPGRDFVFDQVRVRFGRWAFKWKHFHPPILIPDNETQVLLDLYDATADYIF